MALLTRDNRNLPDRKVRELQSSYHLMRTEAEESTCLAAIT
jgi:hypothetical protein